MKYSLKIFLFVLFPFFGNAQQHLPDSTVQFLRQASNDSVRYRACLQAYNFFEERNRDSALYYGEQTLLLARRNNIKLQEAVSLIRKGYQLSSMGRYAEALPCFLQAFEIAEDHRNESNSWFTVVLTPEKSRLLALSFTHHMYAILMGYTQNIEQSIFHNKEAKRNAEAIGGLAGKLRILLANMNLGAAYVELNKPDSALFYLTQARELALQSDQKKYLGFILVNFGDVSIIEGDKEKAKQYYYEALQSAIEVGNVSTLSRVYFKLSRYYTDEHIKDSSLLYALKMQEALKALGPVISTEINIGTAYDVLYRSYDLRQQPDSALKYANLSLLMTDSIHKKRIASLAEFQSLSLHEQQRLQVLEKEKVAYQNKIRTYFLLAGIGVLLLLAIIFYRNNRQKHKAKVKIEQAYDNLKATQQQLIQSEKMASPGRGWYREWR